MSEPTEGRQLEILFRIQRLLEEGRFTATYKFALLQALIDRSVAHGHDDDRPLAINTKDLAEDFIAAFWPQVRPFARIAGANRRRATLEVVDSVAESRMQFGENFLRHGTQSRDAIPRVVRELSESSQGSIATARARPRAWKLAVTRVRRTICVLPLWHLQHVSGQVDDFLYPQPRRQAVVEDVQLHRGVAFTLRRFQHLLREMVRGAWAEYIRGLDNNRSILGEAEDLQDFLFGQPRRSLEACREPLLDLQHGRCFYCRGRLIAPAVHVDHFIPWARFPSNLAHNLVGAHARCNGDKSNHLAALPHLTAWRVELEPRGLALASALTSHGIVADLHATLAIARWAYGQTERARALVWQRGRECVPLDARWREALDEST